MRKSYLFITKNKIHDVFYLPFYAFYISDTLNKFYIYKYKKNKNNIIDDDIQIKYRKSIKKFSYYNDKYTNIYESETHKIYYINLFKPIKNNFIKNKKIINDNGLKKIIYTFNFNGKKFIKNLYENIFFKVMLINIFKNINFNFCIKCSNVNNDNDKYKMMITHCDTTSVFHNIYNKYFDSNDLIKVFFNSEKINDYVKKHSISNKYNLDDLYAYYKKNKNNKISLLICPNILENKNDIINIFNFSKYAPIIQQLELWSYVGKIMIRTKYNFSYLCTHGFYGWLHIRLDQYPKYYFDDIKYLNIK